MLEPYVSLVGAADMLQPSVQGDSVHHPSLEEVEEISGRGQGLQSDCRIDMWMGPLILSGKV